MTKSPRSNIAVPNLVRCVS